MIHPIARLVLLTGIVFAAFATRNVQSEGVILAILLVAHVFTRTMGAMLVFVVTAVIPITLGLGLIGASAHDWTISALAGSLSGAQFYVFRITVIASALQVFFLPFVRRGVVAQGLRAIHVPPNAAILAASAANAFVDVGRFAQRVLDAIRARGLAQPAIVWRVRELASVVVSVFTQALRTAFSREETWKHRGVTAAALLAADRSPWSVWSTLLVVGFAAASVALLLRIEALL